MTKKVLIFLPFILLSIFYSSAGLCLKSEDIILLKKAFISDQTIELIVKYLRHSRRLEICEPLKAVEKPRATSKVAAIYLKKFS